jgi:hypothetical protein
MSIMLPCLGMATQKCRATVCMSNIRQIYFANTNYALNNNDYYVLAAKDLVRFENGKPSNGGLHRWHGVRKSDIPDSDPQVNTFDPEKSPLKEYLLSGKIKECPTKVDFVKESSLNAFEAGCGGYGYNSIGIGSRTYKYGFNDKAFKSSMKTAEVQRPYKTIMFTDTAYAQGLSGSYLVEYSFCVPPKWVDKPGRKIKEMNMPKPKPSIHFRHCKRTNVVWSDGHISTEKLEHSIYSDDKLEEFPLGWFGPQNNSLFRPQKRF